MLKLFAFSKYRFDNVEKVFALLDCLSKSPFPPTHFGESEPVRQKLNAAHRCQASEILSDTPEYEGGSLFLSSTKPQSTFIFRWIPNLIAEWYGEFEEEIFTKDAGNALITFLSTLFSEFHVVFAGVAPSEEWDAKHWITEEDEEGGELVTKVGLNLEQCLPGIYWITVLGSELVSYFGQDVIRSLPCHRVIDLDGTGMMLILTENPYEIAQFRRVAQEEEVMRVLGQEYFFNISKPNWSCSGITDVIF